MYEDWQMRRAISAVTLEMQQIQHQSVLQTERWKLENIRRANQERIKADERTRQLNAQIEADQASYLTTQAMVAKKGKAWKSYYKPIIKCSDGKSESIVLCGNDYIKARREFETAWVNGKYD